jgi:hypothetical protein
MKRYLLLSIISVCAFVPVKSQNPYYDALSLTQLLNANSKWPDINTTKQAVYDILSHYCTRNDIVQHFLTNDPYIASYADGWTNKSGAGAIGGLNPASVISSAGGVNVTNLADGIAKFLIERAKQELSIAFFRNFKEKLEDPNFRHLATLFQNTFGLLKTIDKDIYKFSAYLQSLRDAFIKDLNNLLDTAPRAIQDGFLNSVFNDPARNHLRPMLLYALQVTKSIKNGEHPGKIIENFTLSPSGGSAILTNINAFIGLVKLISTSFKSISTDPNKYWVPMDSIGFLIANPNAAKIYFGLLWEQGASIQFSNASTFQGLLTSAIENFTAYLDLVRNCTTAFQNIRDAIMDLKEKRKSEITYAEYYNLFESVIGLLKIDEDIEQVPGIVTGITSGYKDFINVAGNVNELFLDISSKKYSSGVMRLVAVCDIILKPAYDNYTPPAGNPRTLASYVDFRKNVIKYGTFLASIAEAQNSDEVKAAIEAVVLPVGSSSIKRETYYNISLNAFIGPFAGGEYLPKLKKDQWAFVTGITAPVGVAFSWGKIKKHETRTKNGRAVTVGGKSASIFVPLIDIGALASFRLKNDESEVASEVHLKNIISPGLYFYYGLGKTPISIGLGGQLGPQLRQVTTQDVNVDKNYYLRFGLNITVDIPFFNFYTKDN